MRSSSPAGSKIVREQLHLLADRGEALRRGIARGGGRHGPPRYQRDGPANIVRDMARAAAVTTPEELSAAFAAAMEARDVAAALELWDHDAALIDAGGEALRGREAIEPALRALIANGIALEIDLVRSFSTGDVAVGVGALTMRGHDHDGEPFEQRSESIVVYRRGPDGRWRIALDAPWGLPRS
jgi:uncharacterized protein (TIGR02246 family)